MLHPDFSELEDEFSEVVALLNQGRPEVPTEVPSGDLWNSIADALSVSTTDGPDADATDSGYGAGAAPDDDGVADPKISVLNGSTSPAEPPAGNGNGIGPVHADVPSQTSQGSGEMPSNVRSLGPARTARGMRFATVTAVAAAILLVAVPLSLALRGDSIDQRAELLALGSFSGVGTAELNGRTLDVDLENLEPLPDADYELWLLKLEGGELTDLVSLGLVNEDGSFTVPDGIDVSEFNLVDVSIEPKDGDASHSGNSVLQGPLTEA